MIKLETAKEIVKSYVGPKTWCELDTYLDVNAGVSSFVFEDDDEIDCFIAFLHNFYAIEISKEELEGEDKSIVYLFELIRQRCNKDDLTILRAVIGAYFRKAFDVAYQEQNKKDLILKLLTSLIKQITSMQSQLLKVQDGEEISVPVLRDCVNDWLMGINLIQQCVLDVNDDEEETSSADEDSETELSENIETEDSESENVE